MLAGQPLGPLLLRTQYLWFLIISCRNCFAHSGSHFGAAEVTLIGQPTPPPSPPPPLVDSSSSDEGDEVIVDEEAVGDECTWAAVVESELCGAG